MSTKDEAQRVISLVYKYSNILDCIVGQSPSLLSDHIIHFNQRAIEVAQSAIEARINQLADYETD